MCSVGRQRCLPYAALHHSQGLFVATATHGPGEPASFHRHRCGLWRAARRQLHIVTGVDCEELHKWFPDDLKRPVHVHETSTSIYNAMQSKNLPLAYQLGLPFVMKWQVHHVAVFLFLSLIRLYVWYILIYFMLWFVACFGWPRFP